MPESYRHVVVIGASAGGVTALLQIAESLPASFAAPICIVQHIGSNPSLLPELLRFRGPNAAVHAQDGQRLAPGTLHVAPPDQHLMIEGDTVRLTRGPKENHARPAIDPLFRSAAVGFGPRVIGVVLTGQMDDGTAGLKAVKDCGGIAIVQDPASAVEPEMPRNALANVEVDHCVPLEEIAGLLTRLVGEPVPPPLAQVPEQLQWEVAINRGDATVENVAKIARPSTLTCPDCHGSLWEVNESKPLRYRCHTGHAFTSVSLARAQKDAAEEALWNGIRALREREILLRRLAGIAEATGDMAQAQAGLAQAERLKEQVHRLQQLTEELPAPEEAATP
jgi:two-component system chemotaxis response regulator CheB